VFNNSGPGWFLWDRLSGGTEIRVQTSGIVRFLIKKFLDIHRVDSSLLGKYLPIVENLPDRIHFQRVQFLSVFDREKRNRLFAIEGITSLPLDIIESEDPSREKSAWDSFQATQCVYFWNAWCEEIRKAEMACRVLTQTKGREGNRQSLRFFV